MNMDQEKLITNEKPTLSEAKRALLKKRLQGKRKPSTQPVTIPKLSDDGPAVLSFAQERLWFLELFQPEMTAYNLPFAFDLEGALAVDNIEQAFQLVVKRHASLRTQFVKNGNGAQQVVLANVTIKIPVIDLQTYSVEDQNKKIACHMDRATEQLYDLSQAPLFRLALLRLAPKKHILLVNMHHIISDGWSMSIFVQEVFQTYAALCQNTMPDLPVLPIGYSDYAVWQRTYLEAEVFEKQIRYWQQQLDQAPPIQALPTDKPRPDVQTFNTAKVSIEIPHPVINQAKQLSKNAGVTLYMILLSGFKLLLSRYLGQTDIVVGTPIANRNLTDVENVIGFMLNTLVLRTDLSGNPSFMTLLKRVRDVALGAFDNQDLPFEKLVEVLNPERHLNYTPLFQNMFNFHNNPTPNITVPNLKVSPYPG
ncbi:MAG: condensation domain-containing protein, partial [Chloroflexota bacterium]